MNMKKVYIILSALAVVFGMASCNDELELKNPNNQTTYDFGDSESELQEAVISIYNRIRLEGTFARVGYTMDAVRGDELWNASQVWYLPYDNLNIAADGDDIGTQWIWRDCYHVVNRANFVLQKVETCKLSEDKYNEIKGQALFLRGLAYYTIATYYQTAPLFIDYAQYSSMETLYAPLATQDEIFDQIDSDFSTAMTLLPSRDKGGEWAGGRATCGSAAGYYARSLMFRHKFAEALTVLKDIIEGEYGTYDLMLDYGDNFREGAAENNIESLFEIQYLDYGKGGVDEEWTPVNISSNATQGHAVESNYTPAAFGGWADLSVSPWLYNLFKAERCTDGTLDPRLYWTVSSYEPEYDVYTGGRNAGYPNGNDPRCNVLYQTPIKETPVTNATNGGFSSAKWTYARQDVCNTVVVGLHCGVNIRMMRYSDVLLRAAECINEIEGPTAEALGYINKVRNRAGLANLDIADFSSKDKLFEQIANVERPKEFGCENGRGIDLIRWGFFYDNGRLEQLKEHGSYAITTTGVPSMHELKWKTAAEAPASSATVADIAAVRAWATAENVGKVVTMENACDTEGAVIEYIEKDGKLEPVNDKQVLKYAKGDYYVYAEGKADPVSFFVVSKSSFSTYTPGHEYFPIYQGTLNANQNLGSGNSANTNTDNSAAFAANGWTVRPVVEL